MKKIVISIVLINLLAACASQKAPEAAATMPAPATAAAPAAAPAPMVAADPLNDPNSLLAKRSVYYPFDVSVVQSADKPIVEAHAQYLASHSDRKVRLEGNCDERGSAEYNLGLGQRRADGVMKMLEMGGAKADQLQAVSYGESRPKAKGHNEAAWAQNRRTDIVYSAN